MYESSPKMCISLTDPRVQYLRHHDPLLSRVIDLIGDISCNIHDNSEQFIIETIVGQMLSNKAAGKINDRMRKLCCGEPTAAAIRHLSREQLRGVGISYQKADYIKNFSNFMEAKPHFFALLKEMDDEDVISTLTSLKGVGKWTAKMYLLFVLQRENIVPYEDGAFMQAFKWVYGTANTNEVLAIANNWTPYSSIAARFLYRVLDYGYTKYESLEKAENERRGC